MGEQKEGQRQRQQQKNPHESLSQCILKLSSILILCMYSYYMLVVSEIKRSNNEHSSTTITINNNSMHNNKKINQHVIVNRTSIMDEYDTEILDDLKGFDEDNDGLFLQAP